MLISNEMKKNRKTDDSFYTIDARFFDDFFSQIALTVYLNILWVLPEWGDEDIFYLQWWPKLNSYF